MRFSSSPPSSHIYFYVKSNDKSFLVFIRPQVRLYLRKKARTAGKLNMQESTRTVFARGRAGMGNVRTSTVAHFRRMLFLTSRMGDESHQSHTDGTTDRDFDPSAVPNQDDHLTMDPSALIAIQPVESQQHQQRPIRSTTTSKQMSAINEEEKQEIDISSCMSSQPLQLRTDEPDDNPNDDKNYSFAEDNGVFLPTTP